MTKLQQLKQKIQELRPEIMELKFGCRIKRIKNGIPCIIINSTPDRFSYYVWGVGDWYVSSDIYSNFKILGRDITLEDVLDVLPGNRNWFIDNNGIFYKSHLSKNTYDCLGISWLLGKPLDSQSEETIEFLYKLICE